MASVPTLELTRNPRDLANTFQTFLYLHRRAGNAVEVLELQPETNRAQKLEGRADTSQSWSHGLRWGRSFYTGAAVVLVGVAIANPLVTYIGLASVAIGGAAEAASAGLAGVARFATHRSQRLRARAVAAAEVSAEARSYGLTSGDFVLEAAPIRRRTFELGRRLAPLVGIELSAQPTFYELAEVSSRASRIREPNDLRMASSLAMARGVEVVSTAQLAQRYVGLLLRYTRANEASRAAEADLGVRRAEKIQADGVEWKQSGNESLRSARNTFFSLALPQLGGAFEVPVMRYSAAQWTFNSLVSLAFGVYGRLEGRQRQQHGRALKIDALNANFAARNGRQLPLRRTDYDNDPLDMYAELVDAGKQLANATGVEFEDNPGMADFRKLALETNHLARAAAPSNDLSASNTTVSIV